MTRPEPDLDLHPTLVAYHSALTAADGPGFYDRDENGLIRELRTYEGPVLTKPGTTW